MIWYSLEEDHKILKTKMLRKYHCSLQANPSRKMLVLSSLRAKIVISPKEQFLRNSFPPSQKRGGHYVTPDTHTGGTHGYSV